MPYDSFSPNFAVLGDLPQAYRQGQMANARRSLGDLAPTDYSGMAQRLIAAGDIEGATSLARLGDAGFHRQMEERKLRLAEEAARETPKVEWHEDASGNKVPFLVQPRGAGIKQVQVEGQETSPTNPFAYGKQNENQSKDSGYANRMFRAESVLRNPQVEAAATSAWENTKGAAPGFLANYLTSPDFQRFDQAKRDFVNAVLRRESGAAISQSEFDNANKQYFPQPGDSREKIADKKRNRQDALAGVAGGGGPAYKPPFTFGPQGELVPTGNAMQGATPQGRPAAPGAQGALKADQGVTAEAKAAIAAGKPRDAIIQRMRERGFDPSGL